MISSQPALAAKWVVTLMTGFVASLTLLAMPYGSVQAADAQLQKEWTWKGECREISMRKSAAERRANTPKRQRELGARCLKLAKKLGLVREQLLSSALLISADLSEKKTASALRTARRSFELSKQLAPRDNYLRLHAVYLYGLANKRAEKMQRAVPLLEEAYEGLRNQIGRDSFQWRVGGHLAGAYAAQGRLDKALPIFARIYRQHVAIYGETEPTANAALSYGTTLLQNGEPEKARPLLEKAVAIISEKTQQHDPRRSDYQVAYVRVLLELGEDERAATMLAELYATARRGLPKSRKSAKKIGLAYVKSLVRSGQLERAKNIAAQVQQLDRDQH